MQSFWTTLKKPILIQAPMENVTDTVFRQIIAKAAKPDVFFTEFTNTDGMFSKGKEKVLQRLLYTEIERPIVGQIWGNNPQKYFQAAKLLKERRFDGIDINMGCPDRSIVKKGCCAGLINNPALARQLIQATREGAGGLPVSVKTRIGYQHVQTEEWIGFLLEQDLDALTIHARTATQMSQGQALWDEIKKAVSLRNQQKVKTLIIGNGDVISYEDVMQKYNQYGVDGVMVGRGIFHNLWFYNPSIKHSQIESLKKLHMLIEHIKLFDKTWGTSKNFEVLKKFYKIYVSSLPNATEIRSQLVQLKTINETLDFVGKLIKQHS